MALAGSRSDAIALFRMLVLQALNNPDEQVEYQVCDRLIPAARYRGQHSGRHHALEFREKLAKARLIENLFDRFDQHLADKGHMAHGPRRARVRSSADRPGRPDRAYDQHRCAPGLVCGT